MSRSGREGSRFTAAIMVLALVAVLVGLAAVPARTWMAQNQQVEEADGQLRRLQADISELEAQLVRLETDSEIERRAREDFDLVYPGEESYRILPDGTQAAVDG